jgi:hypothetical protein
MVIRRAIVCVAGAGLILTGLTVAPAMAQGGEFECTGTFPVWPTTGPNTSGATCDGVARGVFGEGGTSVRCIPFCDFSMEIAVYQSTCVNPFPPLLQFLDGELTISGFTGTFDASFNGIVAGANVTFQTSSPGGAGHAVFVPAPPIPSCGASSHLSFEMTGALAFGASVQLEDTGGR